MWNIPGGDLNDCVERNARLTQLCNEIGRDPTAITRSIVVPFSPHQPQTARDATGAALNSGFTRIIFGLGSPYPQGIIQHVADTISGII